MTTDGVKILQLGESSDGEVFSRFDLKQKSQHTGCAVQSDGQFAPFGILDTHNARHAMQPISSAFPGLPSILLKVGNLSTAAASTGGVS